MKKPTICLLDGDILRYESGATLSKGDSIKIGDVYVDVPQSNAKVDKFVKDKIESILEATGCREIKIFLSEARNFRFDRATIQPYKGNRDGFVKPHHWKTVGDVLKDNFPHVLCYDFEADDHLCAEQTDETVIASRDKDLRTHPGWHYSWASGHAPEKPLQYISELDGKRWFYTQLLTGDATDNILGCARKLPTKTGKLRRKGVGAKGAENFLLPAETEQDMFNIVAGQYQIHRGDTWREDMLENGTLLYMCNEFIKWEDLTTTKEKFNNYELFTRDYQ